MKTDYPIIGPFNFWQFFCACHIFLGPVILFYVLDDLKIALLGLIPSAIICCGLMFAFRGRDIPPQDIANYLHDLKNNPKTSLFYKKRIQRHINQINKQIRYGGGNNNYTKLQESLKILQDELTRL